MKTEQLSDPHVIVSEGSRIECSFWFLLGLVESERKILTEIRNADIPVTFIEKGPSLGAMP